MGLCGQIIVHFLPHQPWQPPVEIHQCARRRLWRGPVSGRRPPWMGELHDRFHQEATYEYILRKLPEIILKLAQVLCGSSVVEQFTGRKSIEKCRD